MNDFTRASARADVLAGRLADDGIPAEIIADALVTAGLAYLGATGRKDDAVSILAAYVEVRDRGH